MSENPKTLLEDLHERRAIFSDDRMYRYALYRDLNDYTPCTYQTKRVLFLMMNPSTADEQKLDPTLTRCKNFAISWGCRHMYIANVFAFRTPYPKELKAAAKRGHDIVGPDNKQWVLELALHADIVVAAWGPGGEYRDQAAVVRSVLFDVPLFCLGRAKSGAPRHPLMLKNAAQLEPYG